MTFLHGSAGPKVMKVFPHRPPEDGFREGLFVGPRASTLKKMRNRKPPSPWIIALILLLFQAQVFAACALGCLHDPLDAPASCMHQVGSIDRGADAQPGGPDDRVCIKCELGHALVGVAAAERSVISLRYRCAGTAPAAVRSNDPIPDPLLRPPILLAS